MNSRPFKLALIQMRVVEGQKHKNLARAEAMIDEAAGNGADFVLLPETMDLGWTHPSCKTEAEPIPEGEPCARLTAAAARHSVFVCAGLTEKDGDKVYNTAVIIDRNGSVLCLHRKLNELNIGHDFYDQGDRLSVTQTEFGTIGVMICADANAEGFVLTRSLCYMGADVILSPSAWAVDSDHDNVTDPYGSVWRNAYKPVASDFSVWIAGVSSVGNVTEGPWAGKKCIGCSLVFGPDGEEVLQGPYGVDAETILYVRIDPIARPARAAGWGELHKRTQA